MRLHLGYQNLIGESDKVAGGDSNTMTLGSASSYGTTYAPDGSSTAEGYTNDSSWGGTTTATRSDLDSGDSIYIFGTCIKPTADSSMRHVLYVDNGVTAESFAYNIHFHNNKVISSVDNPWGTNDDCLDYGYYNLDDNWIYAYMTCDFRHKTANPIEFINYVNAPNNLLRPGEGAYLWGFNVEKTQNRILHGPPIITRVNLIDPTDFCVVDFTQLPSNLDEIDNDIFDYFKTTTGTLTRISTHSDKNLKTMSWNLINYVKHGKMIYGLKSALRDKIERDCVLFYPRNFKSKINWALIRVVDFRLEYLSKRNIASVEIDYYITSAHRY